MNDSESIVSILIKFGLVDPQAADTALQKLQLLDEQQRTGMLGILKTADATKELGTAEEAGADAAEHMHINHRALHQILHLIGRVAGPEAGAALAGKALFGVYLGDKPLGLSGPANVDQFLCDRVNEVVEPAYGHSDWWKDENFDKTMKLFRV